MAYISTLLDSPAVVSLVDGKVLAGGAGGYLIPIYKRLLIKTVPLSNTFH